VRWPTRWLVPRLDDGRPLVARGGAPVERPLDLADADPLLPELVLPELDFPFPDPFFPDPLPDPLLDGRLMWAPWYFVE